MTNLGPMSQTNYDLKIQKFGLTSRKEWLSDQLTIFHMPRQLSKQINGMSGFWNQNQNNNPSHYFNYKLIEYLLNGFQTIMIFLL